MHVITVLLSSFVHFVLLKLPPVNDSALSTNLSHNSVLNRSRSLSSSGKPRTQAPIRAVAAHGPPYVAGTARSEAPSRLSRSPYECGRLAKRRQSEARRPEAVSRAAEGARHRDTVRRAKTRKKLRPEVAEKGVILEMDGLSGRLITALDDSRALRPSERDKDSILVEPARACSGRGFLFRLRAVTASILCSIFFTEFAKSNGAGRSVHVHFPQVKESHKNLLIMRA